MDRTILHVDCNKFYASVECSLNPSLRDKPVVVGGSEEKRHGIVLTKNEIAESYGIRTAEPLWQARGKCPSLSVLPPNYPLYTEYSKKVNEIFLDFTDLIEPFGLDESWLDVTGSRELFGAGEDIAHKIRKRVKNELGITVSVGVSFNKVFAKLGSDYKKPDAVTVFDRDNYKSVVWPLPAEEMLFIGSKTKRKLNFYGINTIGDLANTNEAFIKELLGKNGILLRSFARGEDMSRVKSYNFSSAPKSIGNSTTPPRDMLDENDAKLVLTVLCDSVAARIRAHAFKARTVTLHLRDTALQCSARQCTLEDYTNISSELLASAMALLRENYDWALPLRSVGVSVCSFENENLPVQMDLSGRQEKRIKQESLEKTVDSLRERFGTGCIKKAALLSDNSLTSFSPYDKTSFFHSYF